MVFFFFCLKPVHTIQKLFYFRNARGQSGPGRPLTPTLYRGDDVNRGTFCTTWHSARLLGHRFETCGSWRRAGKRKVWRGNGIVPGQKTSRLDVKRMIIPSEAALLSRSLLALDASLHCAPCTVAAERLNLVRAQP